MQNKRGFISFTVLVIIVIIILSGILAYSSMTQKSNVPEPQITNYEDQQVKDLQNVTPSDNIESIDQDLASTNLDSLDDGLGQIDQDLNSL